MAMTQRWLVSGLRNVREVRTAEIEAASLFDAFAAFERGDCDYITTKHQPLKSKQGAWKGLRAVEVKEDRA